MISLMVFKTDIEREMIRILKVADQSTVIDNNGDDRTANLIIPNNGQASNNTKEFVIVRNNEKLPIV